MYLNEIFAAEKISKVWKGIVHQCIPIVNLLMHKIDQCQRYNEYEINPIYTIFFLIRKLKIISFWLSEIIKKLVKKTIAMQVIGAKEFGKNKTKIIDKVINVGPISWIFFEKTTFWLKIKNVKEPAVISHNLVGIKK